MHDRLAESCELRGTCVGVDRIAVTRDGSKRTHARRRGDRRGTQRLPGGRRLVCDRSPGALRIVEFGIADPASDGETLCHTGDLTVRPRHLDGDVDDAPHGRIPDVARARDDGELGVVVGNGCDRLDGVVEVDEVEQSLDDGDAVIGRDSTDCRENAWPAGSDERVGHREAERLRRCDGVEVSGQRVGGDNGVVGDPVCRPLDLGDRGTVDDVCQTSTRCDGEDLAHGVCGIVSLDAWATAVGDAPIDPERNAHRRSRDRHCQLQVVFAQMLKHSGGCRVLRAMLRGDLPGLPITE